MSEEKWDWRTDSVLAKGPTRIAVIAAHPDDPDHGCAGTCAVWSDQGHHVTYVIVTNGDKGSDDVHLSSADLVATREREQRAAAEILGLKGGVEFLGKDDGMVVPNLELRRDLVRVIRKLKPDVIRCRTQPPGSMARPTSITPITAPSRRPRSKQLPGLAEPPLLSGIAGGGI